jgi:uncharacterized OsmC-like protein
MTVRPKAKAPNLLKESGLPLVYPFRGSALKVPSPAGFEIASRAAVRTLTVMQKEALVSRSGSSVRWRLSSDEGPYLQGHDFAPAPLAHMTTGLAAELMLSIEKALQSAGMSSESLRLTLDTRFTMEGSLPKGTMIGGAISPEITVYLNHEDRSAATGAVLTGVLASATAGLTGRPLRSLFSLTSHGTQIPVGRVASLDERPPKVDSTLESPVVEADVEEPIIVKTAQVEENPADAGVGLQKEQRRELHLQAVVERRQDGVAVIDTRVHRPTGSTFRFLSDEPEGLGGHGRAPDAITYISAGIGFCFMTQIGRYAKIVNNSLGDYHIVQDTRFSLGDPKADPPLGGRADAPHTHVYLSPDGDDDFARKALDMSEQTCFIHAMCRTELRPKVKVVVSNQEPSNQEPSNQEPSSRVAE